MDMADRILDMTESGELFEPSLQRIKEKYLELVKKYHPDSWADPRASDVFDQITKLKDEAMANLEQGIWKQKNRISVEMKRGGWQSIDYSDYIEFELGNAYIGQTRIMYLIDEEHEEFYQNAIYRINNLSFANDNMKKEFELFLPRILKQGQARNDSLVLILEKTDDEYRLTDIWQRLDKKIDARNTAWIISRLCSICCYLQFSHIAHNGITMDNLFINPKEHTISLYGGWWYAVDEGDKLIGTTADVYDAMSDDCKTNKLAECDTDQEMVHEISKKLLDNDSLVFKATDYTDIPPAMAAWIRNGTCSDAFKEFDNWNQTLDESWGARKFVELKVPGIN